MPILLDVTFELFNPSQKFVQSRLYISNTFFMFGRIWNKNLQTSVIQLVYSILQKYYNRRQRTKLNQDEIGKECSKNIVNLFVQILFKSNISFYLAEFLCILYFETFFTEINIKSLFLAVKSIVGKLL